MLGSQNLYHLASKVKSRAYGLPKVFLERVKSFRRGSKIPNMLGRELAHGRQNSGLWEAHRPFMQTLLLSAACWLSAQLLDRCFSSPLCYWTRASWPFSRIPQVEEILELSCDPCALQCLAGGGIPESRTLNSKWQHLVWEFPVSSLHLPPALWMVLLDLANAGSHFFQSHMPADHCFWVTSCRWFPQYSWNQIGPLWIWLLSG